jgi:hypothetical protein
VTSIADLVNVIERDYVVPMTRPELDVLADSYSAVSTTSDVQLAYTESINHGSVLDVNFELMYVLRWNPNLRLATVKRAVSGTTAAVGAAGDVVRVNPRFPSVAILDAISDELRSWDDRLFRVDTDAVSFGASDLAVEVSPTAAPWRILTARKRPTSTDTVLGDETRTLVPLRLTRSEPSGQFSSGYAVHLDTASFGIATTVDVFYAVPFDLTGLASSSDLQSTHGLTDGMLEILKWGAIWRLMAGRETVRADVTTHQRPDLQQAVPAGVLLQEAQSYKRLRDEAYDREVRKLLAVWPYRFAG